MLPAVRDDDGEMLARWWYSLSLLVAYVGVFLAWRTFPSRGVFLAVGGVVVGLLTVGLVRARRAGYFTGRVDLSLHALVIADLVLETLAFEGLRQFERYASVESFHDNTNFIGCALVFVCLVGGYRWWTLRGVSNKGEASTAKHA